MNTKECVEALIEWTTNNYDSIPKGDWDFVGEQRLKVLSQGHTRSRGWKRRAIKKHNDITYRLFQCNETLFALGVEFLVVEGSGNVTVKVGTRKEFEEYFNKTGYSWGGW